MQKNRPVLAIPPGYQIDLPEEPRPEEPQQRRGFSQSFPMASDNLPFCEAQARDEERLRRAGFDPVEMGIAPPPNEEDW